jgi:hypothetical protein
MTAGDSRAERVWGNKRVLSGYVIQVLGSALSRGRLPGSGVWEGALFQDFADHQLVEPLRPRCLLPDLTEGAPRLSTSTQARASEPSL